MHTQKGFTLIELIVVMVILGILGAAALSSYSDFTGAAKYAKLKQTQGAVVAATAIVHSKARIKNQTGATGQVTMDDGTIIDLVYGYPAAAPTGIKAAIEPLDFPVFGPIAVGGTHMEFMVINQAFAINRCYFNYYEASATTDPSYIIQADSNPLASKGSAGAPQCAD